MVGMRKWILIALGVAALGLTACRHLEQMDGLLLMKPGSARGYGASCGVLEIREGKLLPRIRRL